jgi:hypothetical protein
MARKTERLQVSLDIGLRREIEAAAREQVRWRMSISRTSRAGDRRPSCSRANEATRPKHHLSLKQ